MVQPGQDIYFEPDFGSDLVKATLISKHFNYKEKQGEYPVWLAKVYTNEGLYYKVIDERAMELEDKKFKAQQRIKALLDTRKEIDKEIARERNK